MLRIHDCRVDSLALASFVFLFHYLHTGIMYQYEVDAFRAMRTWMEGPR